ncbi:hypothetical protein CH341_27625, partial [Rhodoplanes roseus]
DLGIAEDALVIRPRMEVTVTRLAPGAAVFLAALRDGTTIADAAAAAFADDDGFDPTAALALLIGSGLATSLSFAPEASP